LIHPTVWPQYTNVTERQDRQTTQWSDSIGRTVLQTVTQKLKPALVASYDIRPGNGEGLFLFWRFINLSLTCLLRHLPAYLQSRDPNRNEAVSVMKTANSVTAVNKRYENIKMNSA